MKTLIIGGSGFVGFYLAEYLHLNTTESICITKRKDENVVNSFATIQDLDILDFNSIINLLKKEQPDFIYHLAAQSSVAFSWENPQFTIDINVKGTINLLEAIRKLGIHPKVLLVGSSEEYGNIIIEGQVTEETNTLPNNPYAVTKVCQELLGSIYYNTYHMNIIMVRAFNHIGPRQSSRFVVSDFSKQIAQIEAGKKEPIIATGNLQVKRDFTDVRDIVRAYVLLMKYGQNSEIYNVGSGKTVFLSTILEKLCRLTSYSIEIQTCKGKMRASDSLGIAANTTKLREATGWEIEYSLEETLTDVLNYWRNNV